MENLKQSANLPAVKRSGFTFFSKTPVMSLVSYMVVLAALLGSLTPVEGTGRRLFQLGGLLPSLSNTPAGEQQNVNKLQQSLTSFLNQNPNTVVSSDLPPAILQQITASAGLGGLPLPILGSVAVGSTDPAVKAIVAGLKDPMTLMAAAYFDLQGFLDDTADLTGTYAIKSARLVLVTNIAFTPGDGSPVNFYDTQVYTVAFEDPTSVGFIFRGTQVQSQYGFLDVLTDGSGLLAPYTYADCPGGCEVHGGFLAAFNAVATGSGDPADDIYASMVAAYEEAHGTNASLADVTKVLNAGHSLGGALATLGAVWSGENFQQADISMINAGAPRVGNPAFVDFFDGRIATGNKYRMVNNQDVVPSAPLAVQGYEQTCLNEGTIFFARDSLTGNIQAKTGDRPLYYTGSVSDHLNPNYVNAIEYVLSH